MAFTAPLSPTSYTRWISPDGDDSDGLTEATAWRTLKQVRDWYAGLNQPADTYIVINVVSGAYVEPAWTARWNVIGDNNRITIQLKSGSTADAVFTVNAASTFSPFDFVRSSRDNQSIRLYGSSLPTGTAKLKVNGIATKNTITVQTNGECVLDWVEVDGGLECLWLHHLSGAAEDPDLDCQLHGCEFYNPSATGDTIDTADSANGHCNIVASLVICHDITGANNDGWSFHGNMNATPGSSAILAECTVYNSGRGFTFNRMAAITATDCDAYDNSFADYYLPHPIAGTFTACRSRSVSGTVTTAASVRWVGQAAAGGQGVTFVQCSFTGKAQGLVQAANHAGGAPPSRNLVTFQQCTIDGSLITRLYQAGGMSTTSYLTFAFRGCVWTNFNLNLDNTAGYNAGTPAASPAWQFDNNTITGGTTGLTLTAAEAAACPLTWRNNILQSTACVAVGVGVTYPDDFTTIDYNLWIGTIAGRAAHDKVAASLVAAGINATSLVPSSGSLVEGAGTPAVGPISFYGRTSQQRQVLKSTDIGAWQFAARGDVSTKGEGWVRHEVSLETDAAGDVTGYLPAEGRFQGLIRKVIYFKDGAAPFADGVTFAVTLEDTGEILWNEAAVNASKEMSPVEKAQIASTGANSTIVELPLQATGDRVKVVVSAGGDTRSGRFVLIGRGDG